jgi:hypothetical protein
MGWANLGSLGRGKTIVFNTKNRIQKNEKLKSKNDIVLKKPLRSSTAQINNAPQRQG